MGLRDGADADDADGRTDERESEMPLRRPAFPAPLCTSLRTMEVDETEGREIVRFQIGEVHAPEILLTGEEAGKLH